MAEMTSDDTEELAISSIREAQNRLFEQDRSVIQDALDHGLLDQVEHFLYERRSAYPHHADWWLTKIRFYRGEGSVDLFRQLEHRGVAGYLGPVLDAGPRWDGSALNGRRLLIMGEGGLGDHIQFIRFARRCKALGGRVLVWCDPELFTLFQYGVDGIDEVHSYEEMPPGFDLSIAALDLPGILGHTLDNIPNQPYVYVAPDRIKYWKHKIGQQGFKVGVVFAGSISSENRSIPLALFGELTTLPGIRLISLQKPTLLFDHFLCGPDVEEELDRSNFPIERPLAGPSDILATAAIMHAMDLIITADTMPAHLAGSMGLPVWTVLPNVADWRWGRLDAERTSWYPSMRLFRQPSQGDWGEVMSSVAQTLKTRLTDRS